jgi:hypothetical protein
MILRFCSGSADALQVAHETRRGVDMHDAHAEVAGKGAHHLLGLVEAQQAVIDEDAGQLVADRTVDQRRRHRGIDAARQTENRLRRRPPARESCRHASTT